MDPCKGHGNMSYDPAMSAPGAGLIIEVEHFIRCVLPQVIRRLTGRHH